VWSVVVPQCVAYAQIAGLPPETGLMAAPGALLAYAFLGSSRSLVVSATTATSAMSASAVGLLAHGDAVRFAALSAALALVTAVVLAAGGVLRLGSLADFVSKPVMGGFLFGLGLTIIIGQAPKLFGVPDGSGEFFDRLGDLIGDLDATHGWTLAVGVASVAALIALKRYAPALPGTLVVLVAAIVAAAALGLGDKGVDLVGELPGGLPDPAVPDVGWSDLVDLLPAAFGVMVLSAEAVGVARALASRHGYAIDANRELIAIGGSNALAGLSSGFVQSGGASQTAAADTAGGQTPLTSLVAAGLILLTGAFLAPLFEDLPQATLGAIVVVAVAGFVDFAELARLARIRRSAIVLALIALAGVLVLGVLKGLLVAAGMSLILVIQRISRPTVAPLAQEPGSGRWGNADRNPDWDATPGVLVVGSEGPLFYANAVSVKDRVHALVRASDPPAAVVVLELAESADLDVGALDTIGELADELRRDGVELRLAALRRPAMRMLERSGVAGRLRVEPTIAAAVAAGSPEPGEPTSPVAPR
jgi:high affinity sulfate transporter 1